jgi:hypothetical protein
MTGAMSSLELSEVRNSPANPTGGTRVGAGEALSELAVKPKETERIKDWVKYLNN